MKRLPLILLVCATPTLWADEFFSTKIEPLLRTHCFECHSHDQKMKAGLSLESRSGWELGGDSGPAIVPGKPDESPLIEMVRWVDDDHQMPPKKQLPAKEIALLEEWVKRGAPDPRKLDITQADPLDWWSLRPLTQAPVPKGAHPIDAFIQAGLTENGLQRSPQADRRTLIRRLYLDLHGMLPTPEEVEAFVNDPTPNAWENLITGMLASPRYGERWARHWLDVIHFADSHGCEHDVKRPNAWPFRDYVIERLNADVPWGRFIREQLAADVFYPDEPQLMAGLGFIAAGPLELSRASTAPVTFDYLDRDDMVTQTMGAFVSTTANCARCHTHKFDPVTQEDYYALQAVFAGIGKGDIEFDTKPEVMTLRRELEGLLTAAAGRDATVLLQENYEGVVTQWAAVRQKQTVEWTALDPEVFIASSGATLTKQDDGSIFATGKLADQEHYTVTSEIVGLNRLSAVRVDALMDERLPKGGPGRAENGNLHLSEVALQWFPAGVNEPVVLKVSRASADFDQNDWTSAKTIDGDLKTGWAIFPKVNESHYIVFELDEPIDLFAGGKLAVTLKQLYPPKHFIGKFRLSATDGENGAARVLPVEAAAGLKKPANQRTEAEASAIAAVALEGYAKERLGNLPNKSKVYGASSSWSHGKKLPVPQEPKVVHLLNRGDIDKPTHEVGPGALSAIPGLPGRFELSDPKQESARREALADWIAHPENPLTWRSIVNRVWHFHFGRGLSDTPNDFGQMGSKPTHPELLDWLAVWFRDEAKGSLKELHELILTSKTWQQSSRVTANPIDADNRFLWRMNRRRLDAEAFRDSALRITGRLDLTIGGPGIEQFTKSKGPQATPALDYSGFDWNGKGAGRRSIYRVVWRGIPDPFMDTLDFPDMGLLSPKRSFSVSSLQSLSLFNNDFVLHASEWLAKKLEVEVAEKERIGRAVQLCWQRELTSSELGVFASYVETHGLAAFCRILLNSNEFLFVD